MKRGHAEALMPLIARVIKAVRHRLRRARPHRGDHRPRQLYRACGSDCPPRAALRSPPTSRWSGVTTLTAYAAPVVSQNGEQPVISAIDARHDQVYFQVVSGNGSSLIRPRVAPIEEALGASRFGAPHLVGNAAKILADRWPARCAAAVQGRCACRRPTLPGWRGWAPRSVRRPRRPGRIICARPTPSRQKDMLQKAVAAIRVMIALALRICGAAARR